MNVSEFLKQKNVQFDLIRHADTYDSQRLAQSVHVPGREVAKTVLLRNRGDKQYVLAVLPANMTVDFQRASQVLGSDQHLELATEIEIANRCPDCEIGVLPPFGSQYGFTTLVDEALCEDEQIVFEGNTHHEAVRMRFEDYREIEKPLVGSFGK